MNLDATAYTEHLISLFSTNPYFLSESVEIDEGDSTLINGIWYYSDTTINFILPYSGYACDSAIVEKKIKVIISTKKEEDDFQITIPNVFTPNGDGMNDLFIIEAPEDIDYSFEVFDRWGKIQFQGSANKPWNGKKKNKDVSDGTYFVTVKGTDANGKEFNFSGYVMLKR